MGPGHLKREQRYAEYRAVARELVLPSLSSLTSEIVRLTDINKAALDQSRTWRIFYASVGCTKRSPKWNWADTLALYRKRPNRIELAIWVDLVLCGLALGRVSDHRAIASIHFLEARPEGNPLSGSIGIIAIRFLEAIAVVIGCSEISLQRPIPELVAFYEDVGFTVSRTKGNNVVRMSKPIKA